MKINEMTSVAAVPAITVAPMKISFSADKKKKRKQKLPDRLVDSICAFGARRIVELQQSEE